MKQLLIFIFSVMMMSGYCQGFRLTGTVSDITAPTDSTFAMTINFTADQTGSGYLPTNIVGDSTMDVYFDIQGMGQVYTIIAVSNATFQSVDVVIVEREGYTSPPSFECLVYTSLVTDLVPTTASNSVGMSAKLFSSIQAYNNKLLNRIIIPTLADTTDVIIPYEGLLVYVQSLDEYWHYAPPWEPFGSDTDFDSDRPILRVPTVGTNVGGANVVDFLSWWYFSPPTITCNLSPSTSLYQIGTSNTVIISGATDNPGASTLSNGVLNRLQPTPVTAMVSFGATASFSDTITFAPTQGGVGDYVELSYSIRASQDYSGSGESGTVNSPTRTLTGVYPILYGVSATDFSASGNIYPEFTVLVQSESNRTVTMNGSGYIYYAVPTTWGDTNLSSIFDTNGFNVTPSFTSYTVSVTSTGLVNNWTQNYVLYKLNNLTTVTNAQYTFNR